MKISLVLMVIGLLVQSSFASLSFADTAKYSVKNARIYAVPKTADMSAGYFTFQNESENAMHLKIESVDHFASAELHETTEKDGRMKMEMQDEFVIPAHASLVLKEGGKHMMLFSPNADLKPGQKLNATFLLDQHKITLNFKVVKRD